MLSFPTHYTNTNPIHTILYVLITVTLVEYLHISHDPDSCTYSIPTTQYIPLYPHTHTLTHTHTYTHSDCFTHWTISFRHRTKTICTIIFITGHKRKAALIEGL